MSTDGNNEKAEFAILFQPNRSAAPQPSHVPKSNPQVKERAIRNDLGPLLEADQCRREMAAGRAFRGLREGQIRFRPTYKFDKVRPDVGELVDI